MIDDLHTLLTNLRFFALKNAPENEITSRHQASGQSGIRSRRISVERLVSRFRKFGYLIDF